MKKKNRKSKAVKNRKKAKNIEKRMKKEMIQNEQHELEEEFNMYEVRSMDEIIDEMKELQKKRKEFVEGIKQNVEVPESTKADQFAERRRVEEIEYKRNKAYKEVVYDILREER